MGGFGFGFGSFNRNKRVMKQALPQVSSRDWYGQPGLATYGRKAGHDAGLAGDLFLDPVLGSDSNDGTAPGQALASWEQAIAAIRAMPGDRTLRIMGNGVKIRGALACDLLAWPPAANGRVRIAGYGTDMPVLSGARVLSGWTPCTAADAAVVGPNHGSIWKTSISKTAIDHTDWQALLMTEADEPMALAMARGDETVDPFFLDDYRAMYSTGNGDGVTFATNASGYLTAISLPGVLDMWSDDQLSRCKVMVHGYPNVGKILDVASAAGGVLSLAANTVRPETFGGHKFTLLNILPAMQPGGWGFDDDGGPDLTLYCWPNDLANLAGGIEIAARTTVLTVRADADRPLELENLRIEMASGGGTADGRGIYINTASHVTVKQCEFANLAHREFGYGAFDTKFSSNVVIEDVTIRNCQCGFGGFWNASNATVGSGNRGQRLLVERVSLGILRSYAQQQFALVDVQPVDTCRGAHANQLNWYFACDKAVLIGLMPDIGNVDAWPQNGYVTINGSSNLLILNSLFRLSRDGRAFYDQSSQSTVETPARHYMVNCWVPHEASRIGAYQGLSVGKTSPAVNWLVANCVTPGIANLGGTVDRRNNLLTAGQTGDASEQAIAASALHADPGNGDFGLATAQFASAGSGFDITSVIQQFEAWFPDIDFHRDGLGRPWNPADPGIGPFGKPPN